MNVITDFNERKQQKQLHFERNMLKDFSLTNVSKDTRKTFFPFFQHSLLFHEDLEEVCIDMAIEAFLSGASYSKFSYYGEAFTEIRKRSYEEERYLVTALFEYWLFWLNDGEPVAESLYLACESFVHKWWLEGFAKGVQRYRLRLH